MYKSKTYYHGVGPKGVFTKFDKTLIGSTSGNKGHFGEGFYFTTTFSYAKSFSLAYGGTGEVIAVKLNINKPFLHTEENIIYIGEKYNLPLPSKEIVAIDLQDLLMQLKSKDAIAYQLLKSISDSGGIELGWKKFLNNNPGVYEGETGLDLNLISDWYEETEGERYGRGVNDFSVKEMESIGIKPKFIYDYSENLRLDYLTNLGQDSHDWTKSIKEEGYDSIIAGEEIVVFEPEQIHIIETLKEVRRIIRESMNDQMINNELRKLKSKIKAYYPVEIWISWSKHQKVISISKIEVKEDSRNKGVGRAVMRLICEFADLNELKISLTPTAEHGSNLKKLNNFYTSFGFKKHSNYEISDLLLREPQT